MVSFVVVFFLWNGKLVSHFFESGVFCGAYSKFEHEICEQMCVECIINSRVFCEPDVLGQNSVGNEKMSSQYEKCLSDHFLTYWENLSQINYAVDVKCVARFAFVSQIHLPSLALFKASVLPSMQQEVWRELAVSCLNEPIDMISFKDQFQFAVEHVNDQVLSTQFLLLNCIPNSFSIDKKVDKVRFFYRLPVIPKRSTRVFCGHRTCFVSAIAKGDMKKALSVLALHIEDVTLDSEGVGTSSTRSVSTDNVKFVRTCKTRKKRCHSILNSVESVEDKEFCASESTQEIAVAHVSLFDSFKFSIASSYSLVRWFKRLKKGNYLACSFVMHDYDCGKGTLMNTSFVVVEYVNADGMRYVTCNCKLVCSGFGDGQYKCVHERLLLDADVRLYRVFDDFGEMSMSEINCCPLRMKFVASVAFGLCFFILSVQQGRGVLILAVVADDRLSTVTVSKVPGCAIRFFVKCQSGMCEAIG